MHTRRYGNQLTPLYDLQIASASSSMQRSQSGPGRSVISKRKLFDVLVLARIPEQVLQEPQVV